MKEQPATLISTPMAILLGSLLISFCILISGGVVKLNKYTANASGTVSGAETSAAPAAAPAQPTVSLSQVQDAFNKSQIKFGDSNNKLVFIEVADPSCPYCHAAGGRNPSLNKQMGAQFTLVADGGTYVAPVPEIEKLVQAGKASFAYIYFPGHGNGEMGMRALYCANEQDKFWQVNDFLMTADGYDLMNNKIKNDKTQSQALADFLQPVFDPTAMKQCLDSGKYDSRLQTDQALATGLGVSGTPGFFVNANMFPGAYSFKDMQTAVNSALGT